MKIPEKVAERLVHDNPYREILEKDFVERDGNIHTYLTIKSKGTREATMTLPLTKDGNIILQKEYRVGMEQIVYQFSVGILEPDLTAEENCKKELKEETGYHSEDFTRLGRTIVEYYYDSFINYYIATDCLEWEQDLEPWENIETLIVTKEEFVTMMLDGTINCPFTLACFSLAQTKWLI